MEGEVRLLDPCEDLALEDMGIGRVELLLSCTSGLYKGRFLYINTDVRTTQPEGELFGSDLSAEAGVTTYIEHAGLSPRHAEIKYLEEFSSFRLKDCGSSTGTWVMLLADEVAEGVYIEEGSSLLIGSTVIEFSQGPPLDAHSEVAQLFDLQSFVESLDSSNSIESVPIASAPPEVRERLGRAQEMMRSEFLLQHYLRVSAADNHTSVGLLPVSIGSAPDCSVRVPGVDPLVATINYQQGEFYLTTGPDITVAIFKRLEPDELYNLLPGHVFRIGQLEFEACRFNVGRWSERGARPTLEDTDISIQNLFVYDEIPVSYFAVYDGHGGSTCSDFLKANLHQFVRKQLTSHPLNASSVNRALFEGIGEAFKSCDLAYSEQYPLVCNTHGSTGIVCLVIGDRIIACNLGDSKAVLSRKGRAIELSQDHKPDNPSERSRIEENKGFVALGRLCGRIAVSRSFGDFSFKAAGRTEELSTSLMEISPEIKEIYINLQEDEFLLIACDGMFEAFTPQKAVSLIREKLARMPLNEQNPNRVIREVINEAVYSRRTRDNVTAILITLSCEIVVDSQ
jgi:protein phosphatase 2C family protein 2/3